MRGVGCAGLVPLEYSVAWLTCAVADSWTWRWLGGRVLLKVVSVLTCRILGLIVVLFRGDLRGSRTRLPVLTWAPTPRARIR
jgi:hypothetical protein